MLSKAPRAWHKKKERMFMVHGIHWEPEGQELYIYDENDLHIRSTGGGHIRKIFKVQRDEIALLKPTGLQDKKGTEIYEGDILEWAQFKLPITINDYHGYRFMAGKDQLCKEYAINGKVIGNIYEHPDLLGKLESKSIGKE